MSGTQDRSPGQPGSARQGCRRAEISAPLPHRRRHPACASRRRPAVRQPDHRLAHKQPAEGRGQGSREVRL